MLEAFVVWNDPYDLSHRNVQLDSQWKRFSETAKVASTAIRGVNPHIFVVPGGVSACDCAFLRLVRLYGLTAYHHKAAAAE